jgi:hypothetical protein
MVTDSFFVEIPMKKWSYSLSTLFWEKLGPIKLTLLISSCMSMPTAPKKLHEDIFKDTIRISFIVPSATKREVPAHSSTWQHTNE